MKIKEKKNVVILILILTIVILIITYVLKFSDNSNISKIIENSLVAQAKISEYIGKTKSDTFGIYTTEQLLIGSTDMENIATTRIKNNDDNDLLQIASIEDKMTIDNNIFYKINLDKFEKEFDIKLYKENGIVWYIQSTGDIKINYISKPAWWNQELDFMYVGN